MTRTTQLALTLLLIALTTACAGNDQFWAASSLVPQPQVDYATRMTRMRTALHTRGVEGAHGVLRSQVAWAQSREVHPVHQHELPLLHRELGLVALRLGDYAAATEQFDLAWRLGEERLIAAHDTRGRPVYKPWQFWGPAALPYQAPAHEAQLLPALATLAWLERGQPGESMVEVRRLELAQSTTIHLPGAVEATRFTSEIAAMGLHYGGSPSRARHHSRYSIGDTADGVDVLIVVHAGDGPIKEIVTLETAREVPLLAQFPLEGGGPVLRAPQPTEQLGLMNKYAHPSFPQWMPTFPGPVMRTQAPCFPRIYAGEREIKPQAVLDVHDVAGRGWARSRAFDVSMSLAMAATSIPPTEEKRTAPELCSSRPTRCGADTRFWATLPGTLTLSRLRLPEGEHDLQITGCGPEQTLQVAVTGRYHVAQAWVGQHVHPATN